MDKGRVRYKLGRVAKRKGWRREGLGQGGVGSRQSCVKAELGEERIGFGKGWR